MPHSHKSLRIKGNSTLCPKSPTSASWFALAAQKGHECSVTRCSQMILSLPTKFASFSDRALLSLWLSLSGEAAVGETFPHVTNAILGRGFNLGSKTVKEYMLREDHTREVRHELERTFLKCRGLRIYDSLTLK